MNCAIIIPVYKDCPNSDEIKSFKQLLRVLSHYQVILVTHKELDLSMYLDFGLENNVVLKFEFFDKTFFENICSYNRLCMDVNFYSRFINYTFILLYQLDSYVFNDSLEYWCSMDYDYIGAPWFTDHNSHEEGDVLMSVGNGGFSLRKIEKFISILNSSSNVYSIRRSYKINKLNGGNFVLFLKMVLKGYKNSISYLVEEWNDAEDIFFCQVLENTRFRLRKPTSETAIYFAFEKSPAYLFQMTNFTLPFGCHAWRKYQFDSFWSKYIK